MTASAKNTYGSELWMCPAGGTLAMVAEINVISAPILTRGVQDATTHDGATQAEEVIADGVYKVGPASFEGNYISGSAGDIAMMTAMTTGALQDFKIVEKGASADQKQTGQAILTTYGPDPYPVKGKQTFKGELTVTGALTKAANS